MYNNLFTKKTFRNTILVLLFLPLFADCSFGQLVQTPRMTPQGVGYLEYLPPDYATNTGRAYPVLIFLHGLGEMGNGSAADLEKVKANGPPKLIKNGSTMCFNVNGTDECFIVISPQLSPSVGGWWPSLLQSFFNEILTGSKNYRIDKTRVYLTGLSLGGEGVYMGIGQTTDIFAAAAVVAGFDNASGCTISARQIPVWGFHGTSDTTIPYATGLAQFNAIVNCTAPAPVAELKWTSYPNVGHNAWDKAYTTDHSVQSPLNVYEWLLTKRKNVGSNALPIVNAVASKTITLPISSVTLTGTATDTDGTISSYLWTQVSGPNTATLANAATPSVTLGNLVAGIYTMKLTAKDNSGGTGTATITVTVYAVPANIVPVVNAGADKTILPPISTLTVTGSATDADGTIASIMWTKVSGPSAVVSNANSLTLSLSSVTSGTYVFRLTATDNTGAATSDDMSVVVNTAPTVNAGADKVLQLPVNSITLTGTATDTEGAISSYLWTKVSGPAATLTNASTSTVSLSSLVAGAYIFRLTATDNAGSSSSDDMNITVNPAPVAAPAPILDSNIALQKPISTSSNQTWLGAQGVGSNAVDGNLTTRWSSAFSPTEWIAVDLGSNYNISKIKIFWEASLAVSYKIDYSSDGTTWATIKTVTGNSAANNELTDITGRARYVRIVGLVRSYGWGGVQYGYSIYELEIYGQINSSSSARTASSQPALNTSSTEDISDVLHSNEADEKPSLSFLDKTYTGGKQYQVAIFNASGTLIYTGKWSSEIHTEILTPNGFYFYHIIEDGRRIDSGKVVITNP